MFDTILNWIKGLFESLWNVLGKPIWLLFKSWFSAFFTILFVVCALVKTVIIWLSAAVVTVIGKLADLSSHPLNGPNFSPANGIMAKVNIFFPLEEVFAMITLTLFLCGVMLTIRGIKWIREFILP